jgi:hypothetical protein
MQCGGFIWQRYKNKLLPPNKIWNHTEIREPPNIFYKNFVIANKESEHMQIKHVLAFYHEVIVIGAITVMCK